MPGSTSAGMPSPRARKRGVVAVLEQAQELLVIRRSAFVTAPGKLCFPGGAIESGETEDAALIREFQEEMGVQVLPRQRLWQCITPWNVELAWWHAELAQTGEFCPDPQEVAEYFWMHPRTLLQHADLLESNRPFLERLLRREIVLTRP